LCSINDLRLTLIFSVYKHVKGVKLVINDACHFAMEAQKLSKSIEVVYID